VIGERAPPIDQVGVLIFDNSHQWAVPVAPRRDRTLIKRLIAGIVDADGGHADRAPDPGPRPKPGAFRPRQGAYKHIVLRPTAKSPTEGELGQLACARRMRSRSMSQSRQSAWARM